MSNQQVKDILRKIAGSNSDADITYLADKIAALIIKPIQDALDTEENGDALVEVARNAHRAEMELASFHNDMDELGKEIDNLT